MKELKISNLMHLAKLPLAIRPVIDHGSWRGHYVEAVIVVNEKADYVPISTIKPILEELASGVRFEGWKGGSFYFNEDTEIHFELEKSSCADLSMLSVISRDSIRYLSENLSAEEFEVLKGRQFYKKTEREILGYDDSNFRSLVENMEE